MRASLPKKEIKYTEWQLDKLAHKIPVYERVLFFDPAELYNKVGDKIDPFKRHAGLSMETLFPKSTDGLCACGCGLKTKCSAEGEEPKWHRKWASDLCEDFAGDVLSIINNYFGKPAYYISLYYGNKCMECEETFGLELDHIVGVKQGGGGCWLSNYRWLCKTHHRDKTNKDFGFKKETNYKLEL